MLTPPTAASPFPQNAYARRWRVFSVNPTRTASAWKNASQRRRVPGMRLHDRSGLRRTNKDKRRAVEKALCLRPKTSDRAIAEHCGVSDRMVNNVRAEATANCSQSSQRTGRDGRTINTANIGKGKSTPWRVQHFASAKRSPWRVRHATNVAWST